MAVIPLATTPIYGTVIIDRIHTCQTGKCNVKKKQPQLLYYLEPRNFIINCESIKG